MCTAVSSFFANAGFCLFKWLNLLYRQPSYEVNAQVSCRTPPFDQFGIRHTWPQDSRVIVNFDSFWAGDKKNAIEKAFDNWEDAGVRFNCSYVVFHPAANNPVPQGVIDGSVRPPPQTINVVPTTSPGFQRNIVGASGRVESEIIYLSSCKTDLQKISSLTAHEIGHSFGLANCTHLELVAKLGSEQAIKRRRFNFATSS